MPCDMRRYGSDWKKTRQRILERARYRCEFCGIFHHAVGFRDEQGEFIPKGGNLHCDASALGQHPNGEMLSWSEAQEFCDEYNICGDGARSMDDDGNHWFVVVLTVAHLDRTGPRGESDGPLDCPDDRLRALCQRCHLKLDAKRHIANAAAARAVKRYSAQPQLEV